MLHVTPAERRRQQRLEDLLEAGLSIVHDEGVDALTVGRLAASLDLTPGALYRYFPSKGALVSALIGRVLEDWSASLRSALEAAEGADPLTRLQLALRLYVRLALANPPHYGLVAVSLADPRNLVEDPAEAAHVPAMVEQLRAIATLMAEALPGCEPETDALTLSFSLTGAISARKLARFDAERFDGGRLAHRLIHVQLVGLGADPEALSQAARAADTLLDALPGGTP